VTEEKNEGEEAEESELCAWPTSTSTVADNVASWRVAGFPAYVLCCLDDA